MSAEALKQQAARYGTPLYVYNSKYFAKRADSLLELCRQKAVKLRYAVKANPHPKIIKQFNKLGLEFDASSEYEAERLIDNGVAPAKISLSSQQLPMDLKRLLAKHIKFVATSFHQLKSVAETGWQGSIAVRLNPGQGAGHNNRTTTAGTSASFGIWHEYIPEVLKLQAESQFVIDRVHIHIGSGANSSAWQAAIQQGLELVEQFNSVKTLDIGGGFKVARMATDTDADMSVILSLFKSELDAFKAKTNRQLSIEIEPGAWLVAGGGVLISKIVDIVDTGPDGFNFIKLDTGMNDFLRPTLYGAQHPITILNQTKAQKRYIVVGHNCESGDIITPAPGEPERLAPRLLNEAQIGDLAAIGGTGAYSAGMRAIGYNSFPPAAEVFI